MSFDERSIMKNPERIIILFASVLLSVSQVESVRECHRNDARFNKCVVDQINAQRANIEKGFPHFIIGPLDPLYVPRMVMKQSSGPISIEMTITDQIFQGISNYEINSANVDLQNYKMEFTASLPWLYVDGNTKMEGKVLALPINGSGEGWSNYTTVDVKAVLTGHPLRKGGKDHFSLDTAKVELTHKQATGHLNNIFNGNQKLRDAVAENWKVVYKELKPVVVKQTAGELVKDIALEVLDHYSLDDLFPK